MQILPEPVAFAWDKGNLDKNRIKHNVTTQESEEMFSNEPFVTREDIRHGSEKDKRFQALGQTKAGRRLFVAFAIKDHKIRVISVRDMTGNEETAYEKLEAGS